MRELNDIEPTLSVWKAQVKAGNLKQLLNDREGDGGVGAGVREEGGPVVSAIVHNRIPDLLRGPEDSEKLVDHGQNDGEALLAQAVVQPAPNHPVERSGHQRQGHGPGEDAAPIPHLELLQALPLLVLINHSRTTRGDELATIAAPCGTASRSDGEGRAVQEVELPGGPVEEEGLEQLGRKSQSVCWLWVRCEGNLVSERVVVEVGNKRREELACRCVSWAGPRAGHKHMLRS